MSDKELLELAAKAAEIEIYFSDNGVAWVDGDKYVWSPLTDDGDALRLAVKLGIEIQPDSDGVLSGSVYCEWEYYPDRGTATRRAIVRAAAEIGKEKSN
jgi:hypothetical protein